MTSTPNTPSLHTRLADRRRVSQSLAGLVGTTLVATGAILGSAATAQAAVADPASTTPIDIHNRFYAPSNSNDITIVDNGAASLYPSPVTVAGAAGTITDVDVHLYGVSHSFPQDVDIMLVGPNGHRALIMSDDGGPSPLSGVSITFDDEASTPIPSMSQIQSGTYRPGNNTASDGADPDAFPAPAPAVSGAGSELSVFDGNNPNGTWQLYVVDDDPGVAGSISGWSLSIDTTDGATPYPAAIAVSGASGTVTDVDVALRGLQHSYPDDLDLMLVGPAGQRAMVMSDAGDQFDVSGLDLVLDDEAAEPLPDTKTLVGGTFRPSDYDGIEGDDTTFRAPAPSGAGTGSALSVFDGSNPNGAWQLFVVDDEQTDQGAVTGGWSLHVTTTDPAAPSAGGTTTTPSPAPTPAATDASHPTVGTHSPATGAKRVKPGATVTARLSEQVRPGSVTKASAKVIRKGTTTAVAATVRYDAATRTVRIDPAKRLKAGTTYKVVITTAVKDLAGNRLDQKPATAGLQQAVWSFTVR